MEQDATAIISTKQKFHGNKQSKSQGPLLMGLIKKSLGFGRSRKRTPCTDGGSRGTGGQVAVVVEEKDAMVFGFGLLMLLLL
jgi:hypothetical protein